MSIAHSAVRDDIDPTGTERWIPRARAATSASGESAAPMVSRAAPRRAASAASATGPSASARLRHRDDEVHGADPARQRAGCAGSGPVPASSRLGQQLEDVGDDRRPSERRDERRTGAVRRRSAARTARPRPGRPRAAPAPRRSRGRAGSGGSPGQPGPAGRRGRSRRCRACPLAGGQSWVERASSASRTGTPVVDPVCATARLVRALQLGVLRADRVGELSAAYRAAQDLAQPRLDPGRRLRHQS